MPFVNLENPYMEIQLIVICSTAKPRTDEFEATVWRLSYHFCPRKSGASWISRRKFAVTLRANPQDVYP
jgi:hypothetical protein